MVGDILNFVEQIGIPITSALAVGWFLFIILFFSIWHGFILDHGKYFTLSLQSHIVKSFKIII